MKTMKFPEDIPDGLQGVGKELPFRVPGHYFDDFPARLQSRLETERHPVMNRRITFIQYVKPVLGLAAAFAAVFLLVYWPARLVTRQDALAQNNPSSDADKIINLVEQVDDHTFFNLLENETPEEKIEGQELETFIAANFSDYDIYVETQN
jgi:hypothetical protein